MGGLAASSIDPPGLPVVPRLPCIRRLTEARSSHLTGVQPRRRTVLQQRLPPLPAQRLPPPPTSHVPLVGAALLPLFAVFGAMSAELAIEKLRKMQQKLSVEETGPELADMLAIMEGIQQAEAELQAAALGPKPPPQEPWGMDGADWNPALFKVGQAGTGAALLLLRGLPCRVLSDQP